MVMTPLRGQPRGKPPQRLSREQSEIQFVHHHFERAQKAIIPDFSVPLLRFQVEINQPLSGKVVPEGTIAIPTGWI